ncbi:MAG: hypothetical protein LC753_07625, partial [Acidobacteria bacterium]|nr:hypothetical protein [Acidobacteriota bacterium]
APSSTKTPGSDERCPSERISLRMSRFGRNRRYDRGMLKNAPIVPYIPATDVARARKFYEEKVGLVPKEEIAGGVVYECGNRSWIFLYQSAGAGT